MKPEEKLKEIEKALKGYKRDIDLLSDKNVYVGGAFLKKMTTEYDFLIARVRRLEKEIKEILWINECQCDEAYTSRKMHEPNALCGELDDLKEALESDEETSTSNRKL